ncbi:hypothetical protein BDB00DRAFT_847506 [Zychaea mexicana]|uniref:uncharacterized protein n=1 Tax=Zychaea mexicana TaxID=64656 RepID=UPI0022FDE5DC|nr:uncharacterized protein BDB00DRAFT_847506 [Zychaea mexicana]KAI9488593.1 hypothetical protein BDB00DRAFT_847506 [Zychaea mexicana]
MLAKERISQILPTVKCSDCGEDVQIRRLGEHVCSNMPAVPALPILPRQQGKQSHKIKIVYLLYHDLVSFLFYSSVASLSFFFAPL